MIQKILLTSLLILVSPIQLLAGNGSEEKLRDRNASDFFYCKLDSSISRIAFHRGKGVASIFNPVMGFYYKSKAIQKGNIIEISNSSPSGDTKTTRSINTSNGSYNVVYTGNFLFQGERKPEMGTCTRTSREAHFKSITKSKEEFEADCRYNRSTILSYNYCMELCTYGIDNPLCTKSK